MISFNNGKLISEVIGGEYDKLPIYINDEKKEPDRKINKLEDIYDILDDDDFNINKYKKFNLRDRNILTKSLKNNYEPSDNHLIDKYNKLSSKLEDRLKKEFEISSGQMLPIPNEEPERVFVAGKNGSGKSIFSSLYAKKYSEMYPKNKIFIFTRHEDEKAYKIVKHIECLCNDSLLEELDDMKDGLDITDFKNSLVIFDDCDNLTNTKLKVKLKNQLDDFITNGRKYGIYVLVVEHHLLNYKSTRNILNEAHKVVFFNNSSKYHIKRYLKTYAGLEPNMIKKIVGLKSRWVMLSESIPQYILHEHGVFII